MMGVWFGKTLRVGRIHVNHQVVVNLGKQWEAVWLLGIIENKQLLHERMRGREDRPIVKIRSLEQEQDAEALGAIVIWPEEIHSLIEALTEVADWLAEQVRKAQS